MNGKFGQTLMLATLACLLLHGAASARGPKKNPTGVTWGQLALLPEYCRDANGVVYGDATDPSPNAHKWVALMGKDFWHIHHYCYALHNFRQAHAAGKRATDKRFLLGKVIADFDYVLKNSAPDMVLLPEILVRKGDVLVELGDPAQGFLSYQQAMELKPDYWPAYANWAKVLTQLKLKADAQKILEQGLLHAPDAKPLQDQLAQLKK
jgi:tetratricopeptide (TPR) repeat protein